MDEIETLRLEVERLRDGDGLRLNVNRQVLVRLTPRMLEIMREDHDRAFARYSSPPPFPEPRLEEDGRWKTQLWEFMRLFGPHMRMGLSDIATEIEIAPDWGKEMLRQMPDDLTPP